MTPLAVGQRVRDVGRSYLGAVGGLFQTPFREEPEDRLEAISGPVMGVYQSAQVVEYAGLQGWLIILATLNLVTAATNMLPVPPLDGYRVVSEGVQALRGGRPVDPKLERVMVTAGIVLIVLASLYLMLSDVTRLLAE